MCCCFARRSDSGEVHSLAEVEGENTLSICISLGLSEGTRSFGYFFGVFTTFTATQDSNPGGCRSHRHTSPHLTRWLLADDVVLCPRSPTRGYSYIGTKKGISSQNSLTSLWLQCCVFLGFRFKDCVSVISCVSCRKSPKGSLVIGLT